MAIAVVGEALALHVLDVGRPSHFARGAALLALIALAIALISGIFWRWIHAVFPENWKTVLTIVVLAHWLVLLGATLYIATGR